MFDFEMNRNTLGRAGEFFAAYVLERYAVECHHTDREGTDLWCRAPNGYIFTVQVKTAPRPKTTHTHNSTNYKYYRFYHKTPNQSVDYYCFVALDQHLIRLLPKSNFKQSQRTFSFKKNTFSPELQAKDLEVIKTINI